MIPTATLLEARRRLLIGDLLGARRILKDYNPDQPRDSDGRFASGGARPGPDYGQPRDTSLESIFETPHTTVTPAGPVVVTGIMQQSERAALKEQVAQQVGAHIDAAMSREEIMATPVGQAAMEQAWQRFHGASDPRPPNERPEPTAGAAVAAYLHDQWAETSGDHSTRAIALQLAAAKELGLTGHADPMDTYGEEYARSSIEQDLARNGAVYQAYARAEYENTQAFLSDKGITELSLYRGVGLSGNAADAMDSALGATPDDRGAPSAEVAIQTNPLTSWSANPWTAINFAESAEGGYQGYVFSQVVPASRVFSTALSGAGCATEYEVIVLGGSDPATVKLP